MIEWAAAAVFFFFFQFAWRVTIPRKKLEPTARAGVTTTNLPCYLGMLRLASALLLCFLAPASSALALMTCRRALLLRGGAAATEIAEPPLTEVRLIEDETELSEVFEEAGSRLVVVDYFAHWCGPCKKLSPVLEALARKHRPSGRPGGGGKQGGVLFVKVDVDQSRELAQEQQVRSMPTLHFYRNSAKVHTIVGADVAAIKAFIKRQTLHPLLRALSGGHVAAVAISAYLAWTWRLSHQPLNLAA